ncbi:MAG: PEP/pyruvate-binding domain-containing protein [Candidatus Methanosuratincola sp.]|jgi:pyruvate,water dikinase
MLKAQPFNGMVEADSSEVGGKCGNLVRLIKAGFNVPGGFVVPVGVYRSFLSKNDLQSRILATLGSVRPDDERGLCEASQKIKSMILLEPLSPEVEEALAPLSDADPGALWAVRSSATAEDLAAASFAGQQDTSLNVPTSGIKDAVKRCWASLWNERAIAYRQRNRIPHEEGGMAVVVQRMVDASSSGVMFTCNPVSGADEIVVESTWGLGESVVSGRITPDRFVIGKNPFALKEKKIGNKPTAVYLSMSGTLPVEVEPRLRAEPSLSDSDLRRLHDLGISIEAWFGAPQDIEWALGGGEFYILQSRPVTTVGRGETLWTRAYGDEYWADVTSPLFFSWLGEWLSKYVLEEGYRVMGYWELQGLDLLKLHKGHIYFNTAVLEAVFTFNPRFSRTKELLNYFPEKDQERVANAKTKILKRIWAEVRIFFKDRDGMITRTYKAYEEWAERFLEEMKGFDCLDLSALSDAELRFQYERMVEKFLKHFRLIRYGMVTHSIGTNMMVKRWLSDWLGDSSGALYASIVSGLPDNKTIKTNNALLELARALRSDPAASSLIRDRPSGAFIDALRSDPALRTFSDKFYAFLREYGHRSHTREMYFPRWADDPTLVVDMLKSLVNSPDVDVEGMEREKIERRLAAEREILERISRLRFGFFRKHLFRIIMKYAQIYLQFRENQRFYLDHIIYRQRRIFVEYGRRLAQRGLIEGEDDVFFLTKEEIFAMAEGRMPDMKGRIRERRREFDEYRDRLPPKFLKGKAEFDDTLTLDKGVTRVTGTSASPGIATGKVRVVESIEGLGEVETGEILVASNTDPGWTPVFSKLGGLITETGGILSHGAVVSREYGIPAVTGVKDAKSIFRTGQTVTVDGNQGVILLLG